jgi:prepilin-type N-terminal cleavage/methylation domain-containing protein
MHMNNSKGFTMIEMMVGAAVLLVVLLIATSFFLFQSRYGGQLVKDTGARETVSLALMMIKRDIMHAGEGLAETPELSLWLDDVDTTNPSNLFYRKLYVSYGGYLTAIAASDIPNADYTTSTNEYSIYGTQKKKNGPIFGGLGSSVDQFNIKDTLQYDIWGILTYDFGTKSRATPPAKRFTAFTTTTDSSVTPPRTTTMFTVPGTSEAFTPVICYELVTKNTVSPFPALEDPNYPELRRNGIVIAGGPKDKNFRLSDSASDFGFRIRCQFITPTGTETWVPATGGTAFPQGQDYANLKLVEVQLRYRTKKLHDVYVESPPYSGTWKREEIWTQETVKTINVSPRNLVLAAYK